MTRDARPATSWHVSVAVDALAVAADGSASAESVVVALLGTFVARWTGEPLVAQLVAHDPVEFTPAGHLLYLDPADDDRAAVIAAQLAATRRDAPTEPLAAAIVLDVSQHGARAVAVPPATELVLTAVDTGAAWQISVQSHAAHVHDATHAAFMEALRHYLDAWRAAPETALRRVPMLSPAQRERVLTTWNATAVPRDPQELAHHPLERLATSTPSSIVAELDGVTITAHALNARANALAASLEREGVGPGMPVAFAIERSFEMLVAIFAILKTGGTFVPLDPELPADRLAYVLADAGAQWILTQSHLVPALRDAASLANARVLALPPGSGPAAPDGAIGNRVVPIRPTDIAYILYTSGSTGRPKGARIPHRALANHARWFGEFLGMTAADRVLQYASISFDASLAELFAPIAAGARVVLAPPYAHRDLLGLAQLIDAQRISILVAVPSVMRAALTAGAFSPAAGTGRAPALRHIALGGEALDHELVQLLTERLPHTTLGNYYGPTEACIDSVTTMLTPELLARRRIPIGRPVTNARCHILDRLRQPLPPGATGDLYVGGLGLADGYQRQPALTAKRFVPDPFRAGERLYHTGDRARYAPDGTIEFLGRVDTQVKVRGFRIELNEIETALRLFAGVRDAAVIARHDGQGDPTLVAWIVADGTPSPRAVTTYLRQSLPLYAVPSHIGQLDALPMTTSGKLDRRALEALPLPAASRGGEEATRTPTDDPIALRLIPLWERALGVAPVGMDDSFFDLGGHSLKAIHLLNDIEKEFGIDVRGAVFFEAPTVRALAARLRSRDPRPSSSIIPVHPHGTRVPVFVVPGAGGELFGFELISQALGRDQPFYLLDLHGFDRHLDAAASVSLEEIVRLALVDVRRVQPRGPYQLVGYSLGGNIALEMARQLRAGGDDVHRLILLDVDGPNYPRLEALPTRLLTHLRYLTGLPPAAAARYLRERLPRLARRAGLLPPEAHRLFAHVEDAELLPANVVRRMEQAFAPVLAAWERYTPTAYDGAVTLVRAEIRQQLVGVIDDDPLLGWGHLLPRLTLDTIPLGHFDLLLAPNTARLAELLRRHLLS